MTPLTGTIYYEAQGKGYESDLFVDLEHYMTFFSVTTDGDILPKSLNMISEQLNGIRQALIMQKDEKQDSSPNDNAT
jgi:hypothetical protein